MKACAPWATERGTRLSAIAVLLLIVYTPISEAAAHVIMGKKSLHLSVAESAWVLRGRVTDPRKLYLSEEGSKRRHLVEVRVLEVLKGDIALTALDAIRVAQDGHEPPGYEVGDQALFFLNPIEASRELRSLAVDGGATHVSSQEHDEVFRVEGPDGQVLLAAIRSLAKSETVTSVEERVALIREATLDLITSGDPELSSRALASLVLAPHAELITPADVPRLEQVLDDPTASVGLKAGLIAELERRGFVDGPAHWHGLLAGAPASELPSAIRAAGTHPSEPVRRALLRFLTSPETEPLIAAEAAIALGASPTAEVIRALAKALDDGTPRVRNAAIRGLGQIANEQSQRVLLNAARAHADAATRRRASAEWDVVSVRARQPRAALGSSRRDPKSDHSQARGDRDSRTGPEESTHD